MNCVRDAREARALVVRPLLLDRVRDAVGAGHEAELLVASQKEALEGEIAVAANKLNRTQEELRGLTAHLVTVQEVERQRVARE